MITSQNSTNHFWHKIQFLPLFLLLVAPLAAWAKGDPNEVWISARTNALGTSVIFGDGSITNPYSGDFDFIIDSIPTNTTMNLLSGVFLHEGLSGAGWRPCIDPESARYR